MASNTIYSKIKSVRELKNYTQEYVAGQLDMSQPAYNKIESGRTALTFEKLEEIARVLGVGLEDIIGFDSTAVLRRTREELSGSGCNYPSAASISYLHQLYEDKIMLLERLLSKTEQELDFYKKKA
jgi:transcriptional regulator with XRE-family HTH domain